MNYPAYCFTQMLKNLHDQQRKGDERIYNTLREELIERKGPEFCLFQGQETEQEINKAVAKAREEFDRQNRDCIKRTRSRTAAAINDEWNAVKEEVTRDKMLEMRQKHLSQFSKINVGLTEDACDRAVSNVQDDEDAFNRGDSGVLDGDDEEAFDRAISDVIGDDTGDYSPTADVVTDGSTTISSTTTSPTVDEEAAEDATEDATEEAAEDVTEDTEEHIVSKTVEKTTTVRIDGQEMKIKKRNHCEISGDKPVLEWYIQNKRSFQNIAGEDSDDDDDSS